MPILSPPVLTPPVAATTQWQGMGHTWTCNGQVFDLTDVDGGVLLAQGVRGLNMPTFDRYTVVSPSLAGQRHTGSRTQARSVFWPVWVWSDSSTLDFLAKDRAFWSSLRPDVTGTWQVTQQDGTTRCLDLKLLDDSDQTFTLDPTAVGWSPYGVDLIADQPYWYSDLISRTFSPPSTTNFFMSSGGVFFISPGGSTGDATIPNPGDVDAWPTWTVTGAASAMTLGAGGGSLILPALADGVTWVIDTHPAVMTAIDQDGVDHSDEITWNPAPVPAGGQIELTLSITSPGTHASITCAIQPLFFRAW